MAKADVLAIVDTLALKPDTSGEPEAHYDDIVRELGFREFLTGTRVSSILAGLPTYVIGTDTIRVLEAHTAQTGRLDPARGQTLRAAYGASWRHRKGSPLQHTRVDESSNVLRLFPIPDCDSQLTLIRTEVVEDVPYWLELAVALEIMARLFIAEGANQDVQFATQAKRLANVMFSLVGLPIRNFGKTAAPRGEES